MRPMPLVWWLRPVSSAARVGEQSAVVWKFENRSPPAASASNVKRRDVGPVATELGVTDVVEQHDDDVRRSGRRGRQRRPPRRRFLERAPDHSLIWLLQTQQSTPRAPPPN